MHAPLEALPHPGGSLRHVVQSLSGTLVELLAAPSGLDRPLTGVVIAEPDDGPHDDHKDSLVLLIGARGRAALRPLIAAGHAGATAVALRTGPGDTAVETLRQAAVECGTALFGVRDEARWEQVEAVARTVVDTVNRAPAVLGGPAHGDLFSLAKTLAALTGGAVTVEDPDNRVLAYSRSDDGVDEVRRRSILGHACPQGFLDVLHEAGVYTRLRASEEVVEVAARPDLGTRRRLAAGVTAGGRLVGTIWVQETVAPLADTAGQVLRGAARLAALMLIRPAGGMGLESALREELTAGLLTGGPQAGGLAGHLGISSTTGATVIAVELHEAATDGGPDPELRRARTAEMVSMHAAAHRRATSVARLDGRLYVLVPDTLHGHGHGNGNGGGGGGATRTAPGQGPSRSPVHTGAGRSVVQGAAPPDSAVTAWTADLVTLLRRHLGTPVQAAVSAPVARLADAASARAEADRILAVIADDPAREVAAYEDVRAAVVLGRFLEVLREHPGIGDPALCALAEHDRRNGSQLCDSLLRYLDAFGDVRTVARRLHIHPNTLRHRIRRAVALTGIDLDDPEQRLVAMLQLRKWRSERES